MCLHEVTGNLCRIHCEQFVPRPKYILGRREGGERGRREGGERGEKRGERKEVAKEGGGRRVY